VKRREFITLLGGAAVWPLAAGAQQPKQMKRIGVITPFNENDSESQRRVSAFRQGLQELGWTDGRNVRFDYRGGAGDPDRIRAYAAEIVRLKPDVILANSAQILLALQRETRTISIVFVQVDDPVSNGIVSNLAHPGGNITGFTPAESPMGGKLLQVLKEVAPAMTRVLVVLSVESTNQSGMRRSIEAAAPSLDVKVTTANVQDTAGIESAIEAFAREPHGGMIVMPNPVTNVHRGLITTLAVRHRLPSLYRYRYFVAEGGLVAYGVDPADQYRRAASYIDRILKGEKPGDLPVQAPIKYELVINLKTAKAIGLTIPESLLLRADEVIE